MTLADRLAAIRDAPAEAELAEVLGVDPAAIALEADRLTVAGESITYAEAWRILNGVDQAGGVGGRSVTIRDL